MASDYFTTSPEMKASAEVADRNLGFFVYGFCWLMCFWLIYEVLGVWVDGLLLDFVWMISGFLEPIQWSFSWNSLEMKALTEVADRNFGFFVCGFCWLMRFWLIYEILGVWVDGFMLDFVWMIYGFLEPIQWSFSWTSPKMKVPAEVADRRELKIRKRRETGEKRYNFRIYYFIM